MTIDELHRVLEACDARRVSPGHPIYALARALWPPFVRTRRLIERQERVFGAVRALPWTAYLVYGEDPHDWELSGTWTLAARDTWTVPRGEDGTRLLDDFLYLGNWSLYLAPGAVAPDLLPDVFDGPPDETVVFVERHSIPVLINSWHDNDEWRVVVEPSAVPGLAAA